MINKFCRHNNKCNSLFNIPINELAFYFAFCLYFISCALDWTRFTYILFVPSEVMQNLLHGCTLFLLIFKFVTQRAPLSVWFISLIIVLVGFVSWRQSGSGWLFWCALFIVCANKVELRSLALCAFWLSLITLVVTMSCARLGLIENVLSVRDGVERNAMGFVHPNNIGMYLLVLCLSFSVLRFGKIPIPDIILIAIATVVNLEIADSRTSAYLLVFQAFILLVFYFVRRESVRQISRVCFLAIAVMVVTMSIYFMVAYDPENSAHKALDSALSGRLRLAHGYFVMQPLTLFGSTFEGFSPIAWTNGVPKVFLVDNAWAHLILRFGVVPAVFFLCGYFGLFLKLLKNRRWDSLLFGLLVFTLYSFTESFGIRIAFNYFLFAIGAELLYSANKKSSDVKLSAESVVLPC